MKTSNRTCSHISFSIYWVPSCILEVTPSSFSLTLPHFIPLSNLPEKPSLLPLRLHQKQKNRLFRQRSCRTQKSSYSIVENSFQPGLHCIVFDFLRRCKYHQSLFGIDIWRTQKLACQKHGQACMCLPCVSHVWPSPCWFLECMCSCQHHLHVVLTQILRCPGTPRPRPPYQMCLWTLSDVWPTNLLLSTAVN